MVFVKLRETYDLNTVRNKMTMLAVHTPSMNYLARQYYGLFLNYKKFRVVSCDITCACASTLPADPLQIGTDATDIAPQDLFNPILYRAVSNDSFDTMLSRMYTLGYSAWSNSSTSGGSVDAVNDGVVPSNLVDDFNVYYTLLSNPDGFRTANPQQGFSMSGLVPLVHSVLSNFGGNSGSKGQTNTAEGGENLETIPAWNVADGSVSNSYINPQYFRGHTSPMPAFPTTYWNTSGTNSVTPPVQNAIGNIALQTQCTIPQIPLTYVAQIIVPPAKLNLLYYRMVVTWLVEFTEVRPTSDVGSLASLNTTGKSSAQLSYFTSYTIESSTESTSAKANELALLDSTTVGNTVNATNGNLEMVMQV